MQYHYELGGQVVIQRNIKENNMADFNKLKKSKDHLARLAAQIESMDNPKKEFSKDERYWEPTTDKAGNGFALIRFLPGPAVDGDDALDIVQYFSHGFKGPTGKWYIEKSLTTLGKKDPVGELNRRLWATDEEKYQKAAKVQKRKLNYVSGIQVINDPAKPECNGKEYLFRYGKKIYDKQKLAMFPVIPTKKPMNPFDVYEGANFQLVVRKVDKFPNYDQSEFDTPSRLAETDEEIKAIWERAHSLAAEVAPSQFKDYDTLKRSLDEALGVDSESDEVFAAVLRTPADKAEVAASPKPSTKKFAQPESNVAPWDETEDDEDAEFFKKIANNG